MFIRRTVFRTRAGAVLSIFIAVFVLVLVLKQRWPISGRKTVKNQTQSREVVVEGRPTPKVTLYETCTALNDSDGRGIQIVTYALHCGATSTNPGAPLTRIPPWNEICVRICVRISCHHCYYYYGFCLCHRFSLCLCFCLCENLYVSFYEMSFCETS